MMTGNTDVASTKAGGSGAVAILWTDAGVGTTGQEGTESTGLATIRNGHAGNRGRPSQNV